MNDIKFSCPGCGQHLAMDATGAGTTVTCPQCSRAIIVPSPATAMANPERIIPGAKAGDGPGPKVPERRAAVAKKKSPVAIVVALAILVCIVGIALFTFREKIFKSTEYWTLDVNSVDAPDMPAGGKIHGILFTAGEMHLNSDGLTLRTPEYPPEAGVTIILVPNPIESLYGKTLLYETNTPGAPGILLRWKNAKGKKTEELIKSGYSLRIEFDDNPEGDHVSGKIYLCVDDPMKSYVVGKFNAKIIMPEPASPEQQTAKVKEQWSKALNDARQDFLNSNDRETADFCGNILVSLDQPGGSSPAALAAQVERIKKQVRDLVHRAALDSAARLNSAQCAVLFPIRDDAEPAHPNHKTGGTPGPGGLVLYLPFDAPDEIAVVHDASGAGNDGRVYGAKWIPEGKFGGAYQFSMTNLTDRIVIPNSDLLNPDYITVSAWIKTADTDGFWNRIVDKGCDEKSFTLDLGGDWEGKTYRGRPTFELPGRAVSGPAVGDGHWHHLAGTYDGQVSKIYLDGVERGQKKAGHPGPIGKNNWDLCVGNRVIEDSLSDFAAYDGLIDEVRIYNRALSADEIRALATADKPNP